MSMIRPLLEQLRYMEEREEKSEYRYAFRQAADTIETLSAKREEQKWIPCVDRFPEDKKLY